MSLLITSTIICFVIFKSSQGDDTSECKKLNTFTNHYQHFYRLNGGSSKDWTDFVRLEFFVCVSNSAHILLCELPDPMRTDPVYEIALGTGGNTVSELRRQVYTDVKSLTVTPNILSPVEMRKFWIVVRKDGLIQVGREENIILSWRDPNPIHVQYFSFTTWLGGKWLFDCPHNETTEPEEKKIESELTPYERLYRRFVKDVDTVHGPIDGLSGVGLINFYLRVSRLSLNVETSELSIVGDVEMEWKDDRIIWEPSDYENIDRIVIDASQSWSPNIVLMNAIERKWNKPLSVEAKMSLYSSGIVSTVTKANIHSACDLNFQNWPWDVHVCKIQMSIWAQCNILISNSMASEANHVTSIVSEWSIEQAVSNAYTAAEYEYSNFANDTYHDLSFEYQFVLKRKTSFYHDLFFYLFILVSLLQFVAAWTLSLGRRKITLNCFCILFLTALLISTANSLPEFTQQTPKTVMAYSVMLLAVSIYGGFCAFLTALSRTKYEFSPPRCITAISTNAVFSSSWFLWNNSVRKPDNNETYFAAEQENGPCNYGTRFQKTNSTAAGWSELAAVVDTIFSFFILLLILFLISSL